MEFLVSKPLLVISIRLIGKATAVPKMANNPVNSWYCIRALNTYRGPQIPVLDKL